LKEVEQPVNPLIELTGSIIFLCSNLGRQLTGEVLNGGAVLVG